MDQQKVEGYLAKSRANLQEAKSCLGQGFYRAAISRAYYALYQAANAWIEFRGYTPRRQDPYRDGWRHEDVAAVWVHILEELGKMGVLIDADAAEIYDRVQWYRVMIDYKPRQEPSLQDAKKVVDDVDRGLGFLYKGFERK